MENLKPVEILEKTLDTLNSDECEVIKLFFGIKDGSEHSVEDIANNLGKSVDEVKETYEGQMGTYIIGTNGDVGQMGTRGTNGDGGTNGDVHYLSTFFCIPSTVHIVPICPISEG